MSAQIIPFDFELNAVRVVMGDDGQPWWIAADVCRVLGISKPENSYSRLDEDEKGARIVGTPGGDQRLIVVNESGLYALIFKSRKPQAKRFRKWVTAEVLPALRRDGQYSMPGNSPERMDPNSRAYRLREARRVVDDVRRMVDVANRTPPGQLQVVMNATRNLTGFDVWEVLEQAGWQPPAIGADDSLTWLQRVSQWVAAPEQANRQQFTAAEILAGALQKPEPEQAEKMKLAHIMATLGWTRTRSSTCRSYKRPMH